MPTLAQLKAEVEVVGAAAASAQLAGFGGAVDKAGAKTATAAQQTMSHDKALRTLGAGSMIAGGALLAGFGLAAGAAMNFDKAMSGVAAVSDSSAKEMDKLRAAAIEAGKATVFSASEAAQAEAELVKAGVSTADVLGGALRGSLDLAAAGQLDLATSATIAAQAMNVFKLHGSDVGHIADVLAAGANKSAADVAGLGMSLQQGGQVARQYGLSLEETVGTLALFADNALTGSDAGTSLKTMLQRLSPTSAEAADQMEALGFSAYNLDGSMKGIEDVAGSLKSSLKGLTQQERDTALATMFGSDAVRGANTMIDAGEKGLRKYIKAVDDQGAAGRMAGKQLDNLAGDVEQLKGSLETALISGGEGATDALRGLTQQATGAVNAFTDLPAPVQQGATAIAGLGGAALLAVGGVGMMVPKIREGIGAFKTLKTSLADLPGSFGKAGKSAGTAAVGIGTFVATYIAMSNAIEGSKNRAAAGSAEVLGGLNVKHLDDLEEGMSRLRDRVTEAKKALEPSKGTGGSIAQVWQLINPAIDNEIQDEVEKLDEAQRHLADFAGARRTLIENMSKVRFKIGDTLDLKMPDADLTRLAMKKFTDMFGGELQTKTAAGMKVLAAIKTDLAATAPPARASAAAIAVVADSLGVDLTAKGQKGRAAINEVAASMANQTSAAYGTKASFDAMGRAASDAATELDDFKTKMDNLLGVHLDAASADIAYRDSLASLTQSVKDNGLTFDLNTDAGRRNTDAFIGATQAAEAHALAVGKTSAGVAGANLVMEAEIAKLGQTATAFGMTDAQALTYMEDLYGIPADVRTDIHSTADLAALLVKGLNLDIQQLPKNTDLTINANTAGAHQALAVLRGAVAGVVAGIGSIWGSPGKNAAGGVIGSGGEWTTVGEQGRELVRLPGGSQVYSNAESERMLRTPSTSGSGPVSMVFAPVYHVPPNVDYVELGRINQKAQDAFARAGGAIGPSR